MSPLSLLYGYPASGLMAAQAGVYDAHNLQAVIERGIGRRGFRVREAQQHGISVR